MFNLHFKNSKGNEAPDLGSQGSIDSVDLRFFDLDKPLLNREEFLIDFEKNFASTISSQIEKERYLNRRCLLRKTLSEVLKLGPSEIKLERGVCGKDFLESTGVQMIDNISVDFNISHSGNIMAMALSRSYRVGVDIEILGPGIDIAGIRESISGLDPAKKDKSIMQSKDPQELLVQWTRIESLGKLAGTGLAFLDRDDILRNYDVFTYDISRTVFDKKIVGALSLGKRKGIF